MLRRVALALVVCASIREAGGAPVADEGPAVENTIWHWVTTRGGDRDWHPKDPARYTLTLGEDGQVAVRADCNRGRGGFQRDGDALELTPLATTRISCPPDSLGSRYLQQLEAARTATEVGGLLRVELEGGAGTMWFAAESDAKLVNYRCASGRNLWAVYGAQACAWAWARRC
jgi:heat shock protein HslJ